MAYLPASEKESAWIFLTENGTEAALLDFHGRYVLLDGGETPIDMLKLFRDPECAVLSSVSSKTLPNAVALNQDGRHVPVVANLPKVSSQPSGATGELLQKLHQSAPHVLQPKIIEGRKPEPQVLFASLRNGSVDIWVLSGEAKDVENLQKAIDSGDEAKILSAARAATMVSLIVYAPFKDDEPIKRILHSGNASYEQLVKACHKLEHVPFVDAAIVSAKQYRSGAPVKKAIEKARQIGRENAAALRRQAATPAAPAAVRPTGPSTRPTSGRPTPSASRPTAAAPAKPARPAAATRAPATKPAVGSARTTGAASASSRALPAARPAPASAPLTKKTIAPVKGAMLSRATSKPTTPARGGAAPAKKPAAAGQGPKPAAPAAVPSAPPAAIVPAPQVPAEPSAPELPQADQPEPQPDADGTRTPEPSPVEEKFEPEQPNDEGLLDVGEPPMRLRRVSMDTDDQEAQKIIDQIGKEVNEKVEDCQRTVDAAERAYRHSLDDSEEKALVHDSQRDDRHSVERLENAAAIVPGTPKSDWPVIELTDSPFASPHQSEPGPEVVDVSAPGPRSPPGVQEPEAPTLIDVTPESPAKEETAVDSALAATRPLEETPLDDILAARGDAMASAVVAAAETIRTDPSQHVEKEEEAKEDVIAGESGGTVDSAPVAREGSEAPGAATELDSTCGSLTAGFDAMKINDLDTAARSETTHEDRPDEVARKDSIKATEDLLGVLGSLGSSPFTAGLASTIASSIVEGATVDSVRQAESHPLNEPFDTTDVHQAATQIVDNAVGRKLSQDLIKHRNLRVEQNGDTEREMKFEETDPIIDKVLESISSESVEVDRKLSGQTPTEENHLHGQGGHEHEHERQAGAAEAGHTNGHHDGNHNENVHVEDDDPYNGQKGPAAPNFWQHLPPPSSSVRMLPKLCKAIYVDLAFAPRNGTECGLVSEDMVNFYFGLCRAKNVVVPSDNLPAYFLDKWLYAKSQIKDGNFSSTIIPTVESPNLQAFRTMNEEKMASHGCSLKLALDHCSTKVQINDAEQSFHVVKVDL